MKSPKATIHLVIGLEGVILAVVLLFSIFNPAKHAVTEEREFEHKNQNGAIVSSETEIESETEEHTEEEIVVPEMVYSEAVRAKVESMTLEAKVAQMLVTTPEQLTDMQKVTVTGNTTKNAISSIPVGGMVYSAVNFDGPMQTAVMTDNLQKYYVEQFGFPIFLMVAETGGTEASPLASDNGFTVEKSPAEIGAENNAEVAASTAVNIAAYMNNQGLNTNIGIDGAYSTDETVNVSMLDATLTAYKEAGIYTATAVYHGAADIILLGDVLPFSNTTHFLRNEKQYQGILLANRITDTQSAIDAIIAGADMVYCDTEFKTTYQAILDAVNNETINKELVDEAVMRILTYKGYE